MDGNESPSGFRTGKIVKDGEVWGILVFPMPLFIACFHGFDLDCDEDWKAVIYRWQGTKPSLVAKVKVEVVGREVTVFYKLRGESDGKEEALDSDSSGTKENG